MALPFLRRPQFQIKGRRALLRLPEFSDYHEWATLRGESRAFLEPWEPRWSPDELERSAWRHRVHRYREEYARGTAIAFLIFELEKNRLIGGITIGNIRHGVSQSAQIGYWMGERYAGQGYMQDAIAALLDYAFNTLRLHRVEAACIPDNARSIRVLEKAGFRREGLLRSYLRINGIWQNHFLYALIADEHRTSARRG
ncbi:GNAT family protein [Aquamicrobium sp. LC103]|uniref:GNAT family N-acetyltransferase n=1 Tax=Aquamicrobium sp. LC103 TaxID=1120658 RepID=UPI00063E7AC5|nr:GNAT family protein [Aquamicrobium sp. LC103]TKT81156.1 GNAT family N-acetyltransferase [Aquamicrobium sp. LC103]